MAAGPLLFGLLLLSWLYLGLAAWLGVTLRFRPRASFLALAAALAVAPPAGALPALLGWTTLPGLIAGLGLVLVGSTAAAWQTMSRTGGMKWSRRAAPGCKERPPGSSAPHRPPRRPSG